jgi:hypothetical protein
MEHLDKLDTEAGRMMGSSLDADAERQQSMMHTQQ